MNTLTEGSIFVDEAPEQLTLAEVLNVAMQLHQENRFELAEEIYRAVLEQAPESPDALHFFGLLRHQAGHWQEGVELICKAIELAPAYIDAYNNLGNIYMQTGQLELAEQTFRKVIALRPKFAPAYGNLGVVLTKLERYDDAVSVLLEAIGIEPQTAHYYQNLGNTLGKKGDYAEAISSYRKALTLRPYDPETYKSLSRTFYLMGNIVNAIEVLDQWLVFDPGEPTAAHLRSAYTGEAVPERASDDYVRQTFDGFADSFDSVLKRLDYKAPFLVQKALKQRCDDAAQLKILDAGCGTGLCGALLRPMAKSLIGVDLSPKMLERARARKVYDELFEAELTEFFARGQGAYDAVTCADTFCYFGDLAPAFQSALLALQPGGWFIFTLEKLEDGEAVQDFRLNLHGRYSHAPDYLERSLSAAGFNLLNTESVVLRSEFDKPVEGILAVAQAPIR